MVMIIIPYPVDLPKMYILYVNMTDFMHGFPHQVLTFQQTKDKETILILTFYNNTTMRNSSQ
ncbi:hypothetical protein XI25_26380 [Paenibacillus sp. DMB20]|nr:hypothetical protein XI25_26380 [Paenibacillus sp. DMB20]